MYEKEINILDSHFSVIGGSYPQSAKAWQTLKPAMLGTITSIANVGKNMQNIERVIKWAKAKRLSIKRSYTIQPLSGAIAIEFINTMLLPKLDEILHTSTNKQSMPLCSCGKVATNHYCDECDDLCINDA